MLVDGVLFWFCQNSTNFAFTITISLKSKMDSNICIHLWKLWPPFHFNIWQFPRYTHRFPSYYPRFHFRLFTGFTIGPRPLWCYNLGGRWRTKCLVVGCVELLTEEAGIGVQPKLVWYSVVLCTRAATGLNIAFHPTHRGIFCLLLRFQTSNP